MHRAGLLEQAQFDLADSVFSIQHQRFILFHFRRDESLCIDQCLFADVIGWRLLRRAARDLDVIAKDLVVANFQCLEACPFAFHRFQVRDPIPGML